ncbi:MAG: glycoside hydrolase family 15 protein, partial [Acidimicrobiales bacterium]
MPLGARACLSDASSGALVAADGTIDWWCPGRFDAPAVLSRLVDPAGGALGTAPAQPGGAAPGPGAQAYLAGTNVVRTVHGATEAWLEVVDFMPWSGPGTAAPGRIVRLLTARRGPVVVAVDVAPGAGYGPARDVSAWSEGVAFDRTVVRTGVAMRPLASGTAGARHPSCRGLWQGQLALDAGQSAVVTVDREGPAPVVALSPDGAHRELERTVAAWRSWLAGAEVDGPWAPAVARSLLAVRGQSVGGAPAAAATTSLPRVPGGERQCDGRVARTRDAAAAALAWARVGLAEDSEAAERWLRAALAADGGNGAGKDRPSTVAPAGGAAPAAGDASEPEAWGPSAVLALDGGPAPELTELGLAGWRGSRPVVVGAPAGRLDLDLTGDFWAAVTAAAGPAGASPLPGAGPLTGQWPALAAWADWLAANWSRPDVGVWGSGAAGTPAGAGPAPRCGAASRVQVWRALDRATRLARAANPLDLSAIPWQQAAVATRRWLEGRAAPDGSLAGGGGGPRPGA